MMRDGVVGVELAGEVGDLLRLHLVDQGLADVLVELGIDVGVDDPGERLDQALALVARGKLDQVGDVGGVERLDQLARACHGRRPRRRRARARRTPAAAGLPRP